MAEKLKNRPNHEERNEEKHRKGGHKRRHGRKPEGLKPGSFRYVWNSVSHNKGAMVGMTLMIIIIVLCILSPVICRYPYSKTISTDAYMGPA